MESCEKLHVMRSEAGYPAGWLRQAAVLLVLCLLVAGADPCVSILFPKSYSESLEETEDLSTEITSGRSSDGESSVDPGIGGTDPVIVSAAAAETIPTPPSETDAAEGNEIGMTAAGTADSVMNGAAEIPVTDIPPAEEKAFPKIRNRISRLWSRLRAGKMLPPERETVLWRTSFLPETKKAAVQGRVIFLPLRWAASLWMRQG